jgi:hypothetical protein
MATSRTIIIARRCGPIPVNSCKSLLRPLRAPLSEAPAKHSQGLTRRIAVSPAGSRQHRARLVLSTGEIAMSHTIKLLAGAAALSMAFATGPTLSADAIKNVVLVHGAWADGTGWKPVYEILV